MPGEPGSAAGQGHRYNARFKTIVVSAAAVVVVIIFKWPLRSVNFISLVTSCVGLWEGEPQAHLMSITWASHIASSMLKGG